MVKRGFEMNGGPLRPSGATQFTRDVPPPIPPKLIPSLQELELLHAILDCGTVKAAANKLCIAPRSAYNRVAQLRSKSGLSTLPQIMMWADLHGWLDL